MEIGTVVGSWCGLEEVEPLVRGYIGRRCRDRGEIDDIVQETLLRMARFRNRLGGAGNLRGWSVRIACNVMRDRMRRRSRLRPSEMMDSIDGEARHVAARPVETREGRDDGMLALGSYLVDQETALKHLAAALESLRASDREVLRSFYSGRRNCERVARECGIDLDQVKVRLFRARRRLRRALMRRLVCELGPAARVDAPCVAAERGPQW